jgi:actin-like ATPase involved in cell morphogenesis
VSYGLGIDLGTSFTRAAIGGGGRSRMVPLGGGSILMPTVVRVEVDGTLIAGEPDTGDDDPFRTGRDFKHRLGDDSPLILAGRPHATVSLLAATLKSVVETITTAEGEAPDRVVLTFPANWDSHRREHFAEVPRLAGLDPTIVTFMTEPEAAAHHYATRGQLSNGDTVAVLDLGGGSFDTAVIQLTGSGMEILGTPEGTELVGGPNFDDLIIAHVDQAVDGAFSGLDPRNLAAAIALQRIRTECIRAKERLSRDDATNIPVLLPDRHTQVRLTRAELESLISAKLEATLAGLHRTLRSASIEPKDLAGVLLIGGSSQIPLVARRLSADLGRPVLIDPHPQHCVALGAGAIAGRGQSGAAVTTGRRPVRSRRLAIAAVVTTALLAGVGAYAARDLARSNPDAEKVVSQPVSESTKIPTQAETTPPPTATGSPERAPTPTTKPARKIPAAKKVRPTRSPAPAKPKSASLPVSGTVLGLEAQCLDVSNASSANGTTIQTTSCNGTGAQVWNLRTDRTFRALGKCMDVASPVDGGSPRVQLQDCSGASSQRWRLANGKIVNVQSRLCLDIVDNNPADRTPTEVNPCRKDRAQNWKLAAETVLDTRG